ncbi:hypothetical protein [Polaribacter sp. IC063]|uniref:hypothetical protein n=1 Tax=Polaribacter sp. IC063 TaxID=57031 RepID=UPI0011BE8F8A|nr:hypothetical protein [Polaribacter sp. IC063]TXD48497.1 hypothetical protein ES043_17770 [Polaribacter sp. IC063]TXD59700.1 hypothetical protein ES044_09120 [Polaribacter sp. IC066]
MTVKKLLVQIASNLFLKQVTAYACNQLTDSQVRKPRENEFAAFKKAAKEKYLFKDFEIQL